MTSIAILSLLVGVLAGIFSQVSRTWIAGEGNIERRRSARSLTDYIGAELQSAVLPAEIAPNGANKSNLQFVINPPQIPDALRNADAIFWNAPIATETSFGEIAEIGYFVRWVPPNENPAATAEVLPGRPVLCRFFVNPSVEDRAPDSSSAGSDPEAPKPAMRRNPDFLIYHESDRNAWLGEEILNRLAPAKAPTYTGLFAENVIGFWVEAFGLDGRKLDRAFYSLPKSAGDTNAGYTYRRPYRDLSGKDTTIEERCYLPARVRISVAQVDSHHIQRIEPVADRLMALAKSDKIRAADAFLDEIRTRSVEDTALAALLPGLRIYATEVQLENAR